MNKKALKKICLYQKLIGVSLTLIGLFCLIMSYGEEDCASLILLPLGIYCFFSKKIWLYY